MNNNLWDRLPTPIKVFVSLFVIVFMIIPPIAVLLELIARSLK